MRNIAVIVAAAAGIAVVSSFTGISAAKASNEMKLAQVGVEIRTDRDRDDRYYERREHRRDCREVTVRERRGDEVIVRHIQKCD